MIADDKLKPICEMTRDELRFALDYHSKKRHNEANSRAYALIGGTAIVVAVGAISYFILYYVYKMPNAAFAVVLLCFVAELWVFKRTSSPTKYEQHQEDLIKKILFTLKDLNPPH